MTAVSANDPNVLTIVYQNALGHRDIPSNFLTATGVAGGTVTIGTLVAGQTTESVNGITLGTGVTSGDIFTGSNTLEVRGDITTQARGGAVANATIQGQLELGSVAHTISVSDGGAASDLNISAGITGASNVTKNGGRALEYSGGAAGRITNTGATLVNEGALVLNKTSGPQILGDLTIGNNIGGQGAATVRYGAANNTSDTILDSSNVTLTSTGRLDLNGKSDTLAANSATLTVTLGAGASSDIQTGAGGQLTLPSELIFAGTFGTPTVGSPPVNLGTAGGSIVLNGATRTFTVPNSGQLVELTIPADLTGSLTGLAKEGAGTLALGGTATVGGPTNVNAGELMIGGGGSLNSTDVTVAAQATLSGGTGIVAGTINAPITLEGTLSPGSPGYPTPQSAGTTGILTVNGAVTFGSNSTFATNINNVAPANNPTAGRDYDQLNVPSSAPGAVTITSVRSNHRQRQLNRQYVPRREVADADQRRRNRHQCPDREIHFWRLDACRRRNRDHVSIQRGTYRFLPGWASGW